MRRFRKGQFQRTTPSGDHRPVLLQEILNLIQPSAGKIIVDCTVGAGGHTAAIFPLIQPGGILVGFDFDPLADGRVRQKLGVNSHDFHFVHGNFAGLAQRLGKLNLQTVDAIIADLGVSSPQIDDQTRGFSYVRPGPLDMRMDPTRGQPLAHLLDRLAPNEIAEVLKIFGDVQRSDEIGLAIKTEFQAGKIQDTVDLSRVLTDFLPQHGNRKIIAQGGVRPANLLAQVFQAFRILVNRELDNLQALLRIIPPLLKPGGVAAVISFHSGEDRLVKKSFSELSHGGVYEAFSRDPIRPGFMERGDNPRSRSAKLRWAKKCVNLEKETC